VKRYLTRQDGTIYGTFGAAPRTVYSLVEATVPAK
jgi:hypothetical protein